MQQRLIFKGVSFWCCKNGIIFLEIQPLLFKAYLGIVKKIESTNFYHFKEQSTNFFSRNLSEVLHD